MEIIEGLSFGDAQVKGLTRTVSDSMTVTGAVHTVVRDGSGVIKYDITLDNLLVTLGKEIIADLINGSATQPGWISTGTDNGTLLALAVGNVALGAEIVDSGLTRAAATKSQPTSTSCKFSTTFSVTGTKGVFETGLHNAASGSGNLTSRAIYAAVLNLVANDTFTQEWTLTIS